MGGFAADRPIDILSYGEPLVGFYPKEEDAGKREDKELPHAHPKDVPITDREKSGSDKEACSRVGKVAIPYKVPWIATWGGDTSNVILAASKLGLSCAYLTRVGEDPFGEGFLSLWKSSGIRTDFVQKDSQHPTGLYFVSFRNGKHVLTYYRKDSAAAHIDPRGFDLSTLSSVKILHLSGISLAISRQAREFGLVLMKAARQHGALVSFDTNYRPALWDKVEARACFEEIIPSFVDILATTDEEIAFLEWGKDPKDLPARLSGPAYYLIKLGAQGAYVRSPEEEILVPSFPVPVMDTVGAGDAFDAGFLRAFLHKAPLQEASRYAAAVAALVCTGQGPLEKQPTQEQVEAFLQNNP